jgi:hypothetical protein
LGLGNDEDLAPERFCAMEKKIFGVTKWRSQPEYSVITVVKLDFLIPTDDLLFS